MNTHLRSWCLGVLEATVLVAAASVPLLVSFASFRPFDRPKAAVVLALALVAALAGVVGVVERRPGGWRREIRRPLVAAALLLWLATVVSTVFSIAPRLSVLGSPDRAQGLMALSAALTLMAAVATTAREHARRARLVAVLVAASAPVAVFALLQALGVRVVAGEVESTARVFGTLGNPIFLGAYLMMIVPLTWSRIVAAVGARRLPVAAGLALLLGAQVAALLATQSRGPLVGLGAGALVIAMAWSAAGGRRLWAWAALVLGIAGALFLALLNQADGRLATLRGQPVVGRFAEIARTTEGSQAVRLSIWSGVDRLLVGQPPARLAVGSGPETLKYALLPYEGANVAGRAQSDRLVDRAHNELLDALAMTGLPGALALLLVYGAWLTTAASALAVGAAPRGRRATAIALALGAGVGGLAWLAPTWRAYTGALVLLGMLAGLVARLALIAARGRSDVAPDPGRVALLAIGASVVAEAAFGIQTVTTQLVFWVLAGLVAVAPERVPGTDAVAPPQPRAMRAPAERGTVTLSWSPGGAALGLATAASMAVVVYAFVVHGAPRLPDTIGATLIVALVAWLAGLLTCADAGESATATGIVAFLALAVYLGVRALLPAVTGDGADLFGATLLFLVALALLGGWWSRARTGRADAVRGTVALGYPLLAVLTVAALYTLAVRPVSADVRYQSAAAAFDAALQTDDAARLTAAETMYARAVAAAPADAMYRLKWGERYTLIGTLAQSAETAAPWFQKAQAEVAQAESLEPLMPYHTFNRGHLQLVFAQMVTGEQRVTVAQNAAVALQSAFDRLPSDPQVANELALAKLLTGDAAAVTEAVALLEYVRDQLDAGNVTTWQLLGRAYTAAGRESDAAAAMEQALQLGGGSAGDLVSLGDLARQAGDLTTAISYYERALQEGAGTWAVLFNLGLLYRDSGEPDKALTALSQALQAAPAEEAERVQVAIEELLAATTGVPTPETP